MAADTDSSRSSNTMKNSPPTPPPLPASINDIPSSTTRNNNPLSSEEIQDIRSLINVAKKEGSSHHHENTTSDENQTEPQQPLAGRRVMVPVTSKAFYEGILKPPTKAGSTAEDSTDANEMDVAKEWVIVNKEGKMVEMTRGEADDYFLEQQSKTKGEQLKVKPGKAVATKKPAIKMGEPKEPPSASPVDAPALPLVEIRETCDVSGNVLNSEVVNMSSTMKRLGDGLNTIADVGDNKEDGKQLGELLAQTLKEGEEDIIAKNVHATLDVSEINSEQNESTTQLLVQESKTKEPMSDEAYAALTSRLDELESLEAEDAKSKAENIKSAKRLQSGGWSKGFLNKKKNSSRKKSPSPAKKLEDTTRSTKDTEKIGEEEQEEEERELKVSFSGQQSSEIPVFNPHLLSDSNKQVSFNNLVNHLPDKTQSRVSFSTSDSEIDHSDHSAASEKKAKVSFTTVDSEIALMNDMDIEKKCRVSFSARDALTVDEWETASTASTASQTSISSAESGRRLRVSFTSSDNDIMEDMLSYSSTLQTPPGSAPNSAPGSPKPSYPKVRISEGDNTVKEIPRIGQMKVPSRKMRFGTVVDNSDAVSDSDSEISDTGGDLVESSSPFDDNVFKGVVTERNYFATASKSVSVADGSGRVDVKEEAVAVAPPKKKLSRFAQQRLERGL